MRSNCVLRVAVPAPLPRLFDYLPPAGAGAARFQPGERLAVPFGNRRLTGVLVALADAASVPAAQLKPVLARLDREPLIPPDLMTLLEWAWTYYHCPPGEAVSAALPALLRRGKSIQDFELPLWQLTPAGAALESGEPARAPRQRQVLAALRAGPLAADALDPAARRVLPALRDKGWIEPGRGRAGVPAPAGGAARKPTLTPEQEGAVAAVREAAGGFQPFLLDGVAGSGKTEVYLRAIQATLDAGRQALVLVPEIGLTPQLQRRFEARLDAPVAVLHSGLNDTRRGRAWLAARGGEAGVVLGTRSAVFTPLARPGLIIVDEEHDASLKQQEGFRYSARDLAVVRARQLKVPVVLGSATPSLESLHNAAEGRYQRLRLPERAGAARAPRVDLLDIRAQPMVEGLSERLLKTVAAHLERDEQVLVFLNRRGFAPVMLCHECGWHAQCERCDAHLTYHHRQGEMLCHHCEARRAAPTACPECGAPPVLYGAGTERLERALKQRFPGAPLLRVDRDTTRRRGALNDLLQRAHQPGARILVGTQMLAKGHHFPGVTLVAVVNVDQMLFSADFRATERLAQLLIQVAGRSGRAAKPGRVLVQTHHPENALLHTLLFRGYHAFAEEALAERRMLAFPPAGYLALLRAEAHGADAASRFLKQAVACAHPPAAVVLSGPVPAPMERRQGRFRQQLLVHSANRRALQNLLADWLPRLYELPAARRVRWSLDVDPLDLM